jgi:hypothetical protein
MAGGAELALGLTDIVINHSAHPIVTDTYPLQGRGQGGRTARSVATGAGLGSVIGAVAGGGRGAAIGAAAGGGLGTARAAGSGGEQQISLTGRNFARISAATVSLAAETVMSRIRRI